jgi:hypothetical protein
MSSRLWVVVFCGMGLIHSIYFFLFASRRPETEISFAAALPPFYHKSAEICMARAAAAAAAAAPDPAAAAVTRLLRLRLRSPEESETKARGDSSVGGKEKSRRRRRQLT